MDSDFSEQAELAPLVSYALRRDTPGVRFVFFVLMVGLVVLLAILESRSAF